MHLTVTSSPLSSFAASGMPYWQSVGDAQHQHQHQHPASSPPPREARAPQADMKPQHTTHLPQASGMVLPRINAKPNALAGRSATAPGPGALLHAHSPTHSARDVSANDQQHSPAGGSRYPHEGGQPALHGATSWQGPWAAGRAHLGEEQQGGGADTGQARAALSPGRPRTQVVAPRVQRRSSEFEDDQLLEAVDILAQIGSGTLPGVDRFLSTMAQQQQQAHPAPRMSDASAQACLPAGGTLAGADVPSPALPHRLRHSSQDGTKQVSNCKGFFIACIFCSSINLLGVRMLGPLPMLTDD